MTDRNVPYWPDAPQLESALEQLAAQAVVDSPGRTALAGRLRQTTQDQPGQQQTGHTMSRHELDRSDLTVINEDNEPPNRSRRRTALALLVAAALAVAGFGAAVVLGSDDGGGSRVATDPDTTEVVDETPPTTTTIRPPVEPVPQAVVGTPIDIDVAGPTFVKVGGGSLWVANGTDRLSRLDPASDEIIDTIQLDYAATDLGTGDGSIWVGHTEGFVTRVDTTTGDIIQVYDVGVPADGMAYGSGAVWIATGGGRFGVADGDGVVTRLDPETGATTPIVVAAGAYSIEEMAGGVWVASGADNTVSHIDAADNSVMAIPFDFEIGYGLDADNGIVWAGGRGRMLRIDPDTDQVTEIEAPEGLINMGPNVGPRFVWVYAASGCDAGLCDRLAVLRIDPEENAIVEIIDIPGGGFGFGIWIGEDAVYVAASGTGLVPIRIEGGP